jgi:hypothetical protein
MRPEIPTKRKHCWVQQKQSEEVVGVVVLPVCLFGVLVSQILYILQSQ